MSLVYALGVAMAMVPQALPAQVTVALTTGSNLLADRNAVVKDLPSVETLGSTTVICTDKTGTLTKNEMTVQSLWFDGKKYDISGIGYEPKGEALDDQGAKIDQEELARLELMLDAATMSSNAEIHEPDQDHPSWYPVGDPTEAALVALSTKLGTRSVQEDEENPELQEFSFNSELMRMSSVRRFDQEIRLAAKGSTGSILSVCSHIYSNGQEIPFDEERKNEITTLNEEYSANGMRVLAVGYRKLPSGDKEFTREEVERDLVFLGLAAMIDPPKEGVKEAIADALAAKIRIFIITGDHPDTALAVSREIGLSRAGDSDAVIIGSELKKMDEDGLGRILQEKQSAVFARVDPEDKLRIVAKLEEQGEIVAVTGDGVNDAPALKRAHIGVGHGGQRGNDVAKEARPACPPGRQFLHPFPRHSGRPNHLRQPQENHFRLPDHQRRRTDSGLAGPGGGRLVGLPHPHPGRADSGHRLVGRDRPADLPDLRPAGQGRHDHRPAQARPVHAHPLGRRGDFILRPSDRLPGLSQLLPLHAASGSDPDLGQH